MTELCVKYDVPRVWLLTGTPIKNKTFNYFSLLKLVKSPIAENWHYYIKRYCDAKQVYRTAKNGKKKKVFIANGASNLEELHLKTKNLLLVQNKEEAGDMPDKTITPLYYDLTDKQRDEYNSLWEEYLIKRKKEGKRGNIEKDLVELILLRQYIAKQTIPKTIELTENILNQDQKVVIFTNFTEELMELKAHFGDLCVVHNGKMTDKGKQESVDRFQNDENVKVFIGHIISAGVGITLTASNILIFNSFDWVNSNNLQAEDRVHRLSSKFNATIYYQLFNDTISNRMWKILQYKQDIIDTIMGNKDYDVEDIMELIINEQSLD
jgi:SNF2 family DNA or RNA helicase